MEGPKEQASHRCGRGAGQEQVQPPPVSSINTSTILLLSTTLLLLACQKSSHIRIGVVLSLPSKQGKPPYKHQVNINVSKDGG